MKLLAQSITTATTTTTTTNSSSRSQQRDRVECILILQDFSMTKMPRLGLFIYAPHEWNSKIFLLQHELRVVVLQFFQIVDHRPLTTTTSSCCCCCRNREPKTHDFSAVSTTTTTAECLANCTVGTSRNREGNSLAHTVLETIPAFDHRIRYRRPVVRDSGCQSRTHRGKQLWSSDLKPGASHDQATGLRYESLLFLW